jgi:hypothetical protein
MVPPNWFGNARTPLYVHFYIGVFASESHLTGAQPWDLTTRGQVGPVGVHNVGPWHHLPDPSSSTSTCRKQAWVVIGRGLNGLVEALFDEIMIAGPLPWTDQSPPCR